MSVRLLQRERRGPDPQLGEERDQEHDGGADGEPLDPAGHQANYLEYQAASGYRLNNMV